MDPSMALTSLPSSIGLDPNPQPSNRESSLLTTRPDFRPVFTPEFVFVIVVFEQKFNLKSVPKMLVKLTPSTLEIKRILKIHRLPKTLIAFCSNTFI